jgi:hypothetical protein
MKGIVGVIALIALVAVVLAILLWLGEQAAACAADGGVYVKEWTGLYTCVMPK